MRFNGNSQCRRPTCSLAIDIRQRLVSRDGAGQGAGKATSRVEGQGSSNPQAQAQEDQAPKACTQKAPSPQATPTQKPSTPAGQDGDPQQAPTTANLSASAKAHARQQLQPGRCLWVAAKNHGAWSGQHAKINARTTRKRGVNGRDMAVLQIIGHGDDRHSKNGLGVAMGWST